MFGCKEFTHSLKTKDYHQAKAKIGVLLVMAETIIKTVKQERLTPEKARDLARQYFKQALERLEIQIDIADKHSMDVRKKKNMTEHDKLFMFPPIESAPNFPLAKKLDYLLPPEVDMTLDGDEVLFFGKYLSLTVAERETVLKDTNWNVDHYMNWGLGQETIDYESIYQYWRRKGGLPNLVPDTFSYQTFTTALNRAIKLKQCL
jgi:hypothetical protein